MKKAIVVAVSLVVLAFGLRQPESQPATPTTTTTVVSQVFFGAHDALQEDLSDPSVFAG